MKPSEKEWFWRMEWLRDNGFNPADQFFWERSRKEYEKTQGEK